MTGTNVCVYTVNSFHIDSWRGTNVFVFLLVSRY